MSASIYVDRDADLNVPATTPSGCVDGMVISQVIGRGAPELVRFWGEPPLVREPDIALFGFDRLDEPEEEYLVASPAAAASNAGSISPGRPRLLLSLALGTRTCLESRVRPALRCGRDQRRRVPWTNLPGAGGLSLSEVRDALRVFVSQPNLAALLVAGYNPELDADGHGARKLIDLLAEVLASRLESTSAAAAGASETATASPSLAHRLPNLHLPYSPPLRVPRLSLIAPPPVTCRTRPNRTQTYPDNGQTLSLDCPPLASRSDCVSCCLLR